jgi:hypothetical protein
MQSPMCLVDRGEYKGRRFAVAGTVVVQSTARAIRHAGCRITELARAQSSGLMYSRICWCGSTCNSCNCTHSTHCNMVSSPSQGLMVPSTQPAAQKSVSHLGMQWQLPAGSWLAAGLILLPAARQSCFCVLADPAVPDRSATTSIANQRQHRRQQEAISSQDNRNRAHVSLEQQKQQQQCCSGSSREQQQPAARLHCLTCKPPSAHIAVVMNVWRAYSQHAVLLSCPTAAPPGPRNTPAAGRAVAHWHVCI